MQYLQILTAFAFLVSKAPVYGQGFNSAIVPNDAYIGELTTITVTVPAALVNVSIALWRQGPGTGSTRGVPPVFTEVLFTNVPVDANGYAYLQWTPDSSIPVIVFDYYLNLTDATGGLGLSNYFEIHPANVVSSSTSSTSTVSTTSSSTSSTSTSSINTLSSSSRSSSSISSSISTPSLQLTTSTVYATSLRTIYSCAVEVTDCPARSKTAIVITDTIAVYTTVCPVAQTNTAVYITPTAPLSTTKVITLTSYPNGSSLAVISTVTTVVPCAATPTTTVLPAPNSIPAGKPINSATASSKYSSVGNGTAVATHLAFTGGATRAAAGCVGLLGLLPYIL